MKTARIIFFILIFIIFFSFVSADEIGVNPGGNEEVGLNPIGKEPESPILCLTMITCAGLGYSCGSVGDGCGGTLNCGSCSSGQTCSSGACITSGAGTGGATPGEIVSYAKNLTISPKEFNLKMSINTNKLEEIKITNIGDTTQTVSISQKGLDNKIILGNTSISLHPGETKNVEVTFVAPGKIGIYNGTIIIKGIEIPVSMDVREKFLLFDSNIIVLNRNYKVSREEKLKTKVTLIPMGDKERLDVLLKYTIKDSSGKVYITQSETVLIENKINFKKNFDIGGLPLGIYIVNLELVYPGGIAQSSAQFEVVEVTPTSLLGDIVYYIIVMIFIVSIVLVFIIFRQKIIRTQ